MLRICWTILLAATFTAIALGDRKLEPAEVELLLQTLTSQPRESWIPYGTMQAHHLQYQESLNKITDSTEIVRFDGTRYAMQVELNPDQSLDMNRPDAPNTLDSQPPSEDFLMNRSNLYVWTGQKQVRYYKASDYAVVLLGQENSSASIYGAPVAGIIPWGHGDCSLAVLRSNAPSAYELSNADDTKILLEYTESKYRPAARVTFLLDPALGYSVLSYSIENDLALLRNTYDGYRQMGPWWVPSKIMIERFDKRSGISTLISYDDWSFESVVFEMPPNSAFKAEFEPGTIVEMQPAQSVKTFLYQTPHNQDIEPILEDKILITSAEQTEPANCATAAFSHIARKFAKNVSHERITGLVQSENHKTNLAAFKTALEEIGLECMAVTTDIDNLGKFANSVKIVHLPAHNHYVIVDRIEPDAVWIIDLLNRKFYWKKQLSEFLMEWTEGTALLVSDKPIELPADCRFNYLNPLQLSVIQGGDYTGYSCTDKIQDYQHVLCPHPVGFMCSGQYYKFYERYGCKQDAGGGTCVGQMMVGYEFTQCIDRLQGGCTITGIWESRYIRACQ